MTSFYQSLTVNTEVSHVVYVRASCLQGVLLARNLLELLFMGTQGHDAVVPYLPERAEGVITSFCIIISILFN